MYRTGRQGARSRRVLVSAFDDRAGLGAIGKPII
jgi:hypothetical protein